MKSDIISHPLDDQHEFWTGVLPKELRLDKAAFQQLWNLHPPEYHNIQMHGRLVKTPRWQQAYGTAYYYSGRINQALPLPPLLVPLLHWGQDTLEERLNGILVNWYDASLGHYIGKHRDSRHQLVVGAPIVTISLGEERIFRLRPWQGTGQRDFTAPDGSFFVMPYATNLAWTHEVPCSKRSQGKRISITLRAFERSRVS